MLIISDLNHFLLVMKEKPCEGAPISYILNKFFFWNAEKNEIPLANSWTSNRTP